GLVQSHRQLLAKIAGMAPENLASLSENFPVQLIDSQAHQLIGGGPRSRRQFLDWGVFHVEPAFFPSWRKYQRALQQRNALLRAKRALKEMAGWDEELVVHGNALDRMRRAYLANLLPTALQWASQALGGAEINLDYHSGWPEELSLSTAIEKTIHRDYESGSTRCGPHRAEISIRINGNAARERISMGQEKVLAGSLLLAQTVIYRSLTGRVCTLLLDDLPSELDSIHQQRFLQRVLETGSQTLITAIESGQWIMDVAAKLFHVEQGKIT
ncbi:MAG: DNA replication and repair protein RecF, partial [Gammaproteobacteria bacterium]|nr:DNA replication and repair protein RecF [Gammaproteobacteria bacterium]